MLEIGVAADQIICNNKLSALFAEKVVDKLGLHVNVTVDDIRRRILTLRKKGQDKSGLPRLERNYFGRN